MEITIWGWIAIALILIGIPTWWGLTLYILCKEIDEL